LDVLLELQPPNLRKGETLHLQAVLEAKTGGEEISGRLLRGEGDVLRSLGFLEVSVPEEEKAGG
jgi:hypothetical protein